MNTFGHLFRVTTFGESHGVALGAVIDGCPPGIEIDESDIQRELDRRRPGQSSVTTPRQEGDKCQILSGVFEGKTTGMPIAIVVYNDDQRSKDYSALKEVFRPSHADFSFFQKYGIRDHRGGGRSSGRETVSRVAAGAIAKKILKQWFGADIFGFSQSIGGECFPGFEKAFIEQNPLRMADKYQFATILQKVERIKESGDSLGGIVEIRAENCPSGLGSPVFGKLEAELARACMSVGATKGFEMGEGFALSGKKGSEANDPFVNSPLDTCPPKPEGRRGKGGLGGIKTQRNANGGILGGISTGETIWFHVAIKPTSSISQKQTTVNTKGETVELEITGRHDPIIVPRVIPVLEAMTALVLMDQVLMQRGQCGVPN